MNTIFVLLFDGSGVYVKRIVGSPVAEVFARVSARSRSLSTATREKSNAHPGGVRVAACLARSESGDGIRRGWPTGSVAAR
jgi:hypothetical protein